MLLPGLFWAGNAIVARSVAGEIPPVALAFWRWAVGAALILPFAWPHLKRDCPIMLGRWPLMLALSALGIAVFNTCLYIAAHTTTAVNIVMLQSSMPVFIVAASFMLFRETVTLRQGVGFAMSLLGALTLISHGDPGVFARLDFKPGDLWMLVAVVSYALYTAMLRLRPDVHGLSFIFATFLIGAILLIPIYAWETWSGHPLPLTAKSMLAIGYVAIFASILAYISFNRVVELVGANTAGLVAHLVPVFGTILAVLLLDETLHTYNGVGIALIGLGVWLATLRRAA
jgi:drug/metabolite transporter (DMT)-like permease